MEIMATDDSGNQYSAGTSSIEFFAKLPDYFDDYSHVGIEAHFISKVPNDTVAHGETVYQWLAYPWEEEVTEWDETTQTDVTSMQTTYFGLACA